MISNDILIDCIEKDVIEEVLGTKNIEEALAKLNQEEKQEQNRIRNQLIKESVKRKLRILKGELKEEGTRRKYATDFLSALLDEKGIDEKNLDKIAQKLKLSEISYFLSYFKNSTKATYLYKIVPKENNFDVIKHLKKINKEFLEKKFEMLMKENSGYGNHQFSLSEYGAPILRKLKSKPTPHVIYFENENCIFLDFWTIGEEMIYFDAKEGDFKKIYPRQQVLCRVHLDRAIMELQEVASSDKNINNVTSYLTTLLKNDEILFQEVQDIKEDQFRAIESHLTKSHEKHEGNEASSALTRTHSDGDTRNDRQLHPIISRRRFSVLNGIITDNIPNVNYPVMISLNKGGYFMIKTKTTTPSERKEIVDWLWGFLS